MTSNHLEKTLRFYLDTWSKHYRPARQDTSDMFPAGERAKAMQHAMWMCELALDFVKKPDEVDKAHRWLGFIQATLWACGHYTIDEMRALSTEPTDP
jgi:hypothetical protein